MRGANTYITIWNRKGNDFYRFNLPVLCRGTQKTDYNRLSAASAEGVIISTTVFRIPYTPEFLMPDEWLALDEDERPLYYTYQADDLIAAGIHVWDIGKPDEENPDIVTLPELRKKLKYALIQVQSCNYNIGVMHGRHVKIEGV